MLPWSGRFSAYCWIGSGEFGAVQVLMVRHSFRLRRRVELLDGRLLLFAVCLDAMLCARVRCFCS